MPYYLYPQVIYTDGCCFNNGRPDARAGYGVFWGDNSPNNLARKLIGPIQTNQRAEARAVLAALEQTSGFPDDVEIRTDSIYVVRAVNEWSVKWEKNQWRNAKGFPVVNQDILKAILHYIDNRPGRVVVKHVRGHANEYGNERADLLAKIGANTGLGEMGRRRWRPYGNRGIYYTIFTDGACINNGRPWARAGFGVFWGDDDPRNVAERLYGPQQTNQRAEAQAVLTALEQTDGFYDTVEIKTDSIYVVRAINEWCYKWENNGWINAKGLPVANQDIFQDIIYQMENRPGDVYVNHVPGHAGIYGNEMADELAREGAEMDSEDEDEDESYYSSDSNGYNNYSDSDSESNNGYYYY
ncbi:hypothetical protein MBANPS3_010608 [Mucor bainieri]